MKPIYLLLMLVFTTFYTSCHTKEKTADNTQNTTKTSENDTVLTVDKATKLLQETITAHGGKLYNTAHYEFVFRDKKYRFKNDGISFVYEVESTKNDTVTKDILDNETFTRLVNTKATKLSAKKTKSATEAVNSVIYFATLPHKLNDAAVHKTYVEETTIKGKKYDVLKITFRKEGGGEDFQDEYHYWISQNTKKIDYLAYNYQVNGGGVRFRSAYNVRVIDGITFQDYINYKAEVGTPLKALPKLYEAGKLKELSKIETQQIINLKNQT